MGRFFWKQSVQCKNFTNNIGQILISHISPLCPVGKCAAVNSPCSHWHVQKGKSNQRWIFKTRSFSAHIQKLVASVASSLRRETQERKTLSRKTVYLSVFFGFMVLSPSAEIKWLHYSSRNWTSKLTAWSWQCDSKFIHVADTQEPRSIDQENI